MDFGHQSGIHRRDCDNRPYERYVDSSIKEEANGVGEVRLKEKCVQDIRHLVKSQGMYFMIITYLVFMLTIRNRPH